VTAKVSKAKKVSFTFEQTITRGDVILCQGNIRIACLDVQTLRPKAIPEILIRALEHTINEY
jgi:acyl-CoA thioester hydrolase